MVVLGTTIHASFLFFHAIGTEKLVDARPSPGMTTERAGPATFYVMRGLDPRIHAAVIWHAEGWMAGSSPAMTKGVNESEPDSRASSPSMTIGRR